MTPPEIQIACAKACGWTVTRADDGEWLLKGPDCKIRMTEWAYETVDLTWFRHVLPRYTESHDAMAEALGTMTDEEWKNYVKYLGNSIGPDGYTSVDLLRATPLQKAVAFLKAKNLYHE